MTYLQVTCHIIILGCLLTIIFCAALLIKEDAHIYYVQPTEGVVFLNKTRGVCPDYRHPPLFVFDSTCMISTNVGHQPA